MVPWSWPPGPSIHPLSFAGTSNQASGCPADPSITSRTSRDDSFSAQMRNRTSPRSHPETSRSRLIPRTATLNLTVAFRQTGSPRRSARRTRRRARPGSQGLRGRSTRLGTNRGAGLIATASARSTGSPNRRTRKACDEGEDDTGQGPGHFAKDQRTGHEDGRGISGTSGARRLSRPGDLIAEPKPEPHQPVSTPVDLPARDGQDTGSSASRFETLPRRRPTTLEAIQRTTIIALTRTRTIASRSAITEAGIHESGISLIPGNH